MAIPLQLGHGFEAVETTRAGGEAERRARCFNWATALRPWKLASSTLTLPSPLLLQLGHGFEAVETALSWGRPRCLVKLQLGHGFEAVETCPSG